MQASELPPYVLVCHKDDKRLAPECFRKSWPLLEVGEIVAFEIPSDWLVHMERRSTNPSGVTIHRILDRFYLCVPTFDEGKRQALIDNFFELIGESYDSLVDVKRNVSNIRNLIYILQDVVGPLNGREIIDYGCGSGLSLEIASEFNVAIIGYDRCHMMRQRAASRGMRVWGPGELAQRPEGSVLGAFASYVFHLLPHTGGLELLWSRLNSRGALVANFHKGLGIELVNDCMRSRGARIFQPAAGTAEELHGPNFVYVKEA